MSSIAFRLTPVHFKSFNVTGPQKSALSFAHRASSGWGATVKLAQLPTHSGILLTQPACPSLPIHVPQASWPFSALLLRPTDRPTDRPTAFRPFSRLPSFLPFFRLSEDSIKLCRKRRRRRCLFCAATEGQREGRGEREERALWKTVGRCLPRCDARDTIKKAIHLLDITACASERSSVIVSKAK